MRKHMPDLMIVIASLIFLLSAAEMFQFAGFAEYGEYGPAWRGFFALFKPKNIIPTYRMFGLEMLVLALVNGAAITLTFFANAKRAW